jgi:hypothetical protein
MTGNSKKTMLISFPKNKFDVNYSRHFVSVSKLVFSVINC